MTDLKLPDKFDNCVVRDLIYSIRDHLYKDDFWMSLEKVNDSNACDYGLFRSCAPDWAHRAEGKINKSYKERSEDLLQLYKILYSYAK